MHKSCLARLGRVSEYIEQNGISTTEMNGHDVDDSTHATSQNAELVRNEVDRFLLNSVYLPCRDLIALGQHVLPIHQAAGPSSIDVNMEVRMMHEHDMCNGIELFGPANNTSVFVGEDPAISGSWSRDIFGSLRLNPAVNRCTRRTCPVVYVFTLVILKKKIRK